MRTELLLTARKTKVCRQSHGMNLRFIEWIFAVIAAVLLLAFATIVDSVQASVGEINWGLGKKEGLGYRQEC